MPDNNAISSKIGTVTLTDKIYTTNVDTGIKCISLKLLAGTVTYQGTESITADDGAAVPSAAETLGPDGFEVVGENPIDGFIIDASAGSVLIAFVKG